MIDQRLERCYAHFDRFCTAKLKQQYEDLVANPLPSSPGEFFRGPWTMRMVLALPLAIAGALISLPLCYFEWKKRRSDEKALLSRILAQPERPAALGQVDSLGKLWNVTVLSSRHTFYIRERRELLLLFVTELYGSAVTARLDLDVISRTLSLADQLTSDTSEAAGLRFRMAPHEDRIVEHLDRLLPPFNFSSAGIVALRVLEDRRQSRN